VSRTALRAAQVAALAALVAAALALRGRDVGAPLWMDEGIAAGIASHRLAEIPGLLRLDGSPPLYYVVLRAWMGLAGRSEAAVHWLSVVFATLCVPVGWWVGASAFDRRVGWVLAALAAGNPFLTDYAHQARMYSLVILLGLACTGLFVQAYVRGRRRLAVPFGVVLALLLYTHNWALLLAAALVLAFALVVAAAREQGHAARVRDGLAGFGLAALLYLPWLPTVLFQARHTGAPWATAPSPGALASVPADLLGGVAAAAIAGLVAGAALVRRRTRWRWSRTDRLAVVVLVASATVPVALGWALSQLTPAWDSRYLAIVVAPALTLLAVAIARTRALGLVALGVLVALSLPPRPPPVASNADDVGRAATPSLRRGDIVVSAAPAQVPVLAYYLPPGLRYASPLGPSRDPGLVDWRDAVDRLRRSSPQRDVAALVRARPRARVLLVLPARWDARSARTPYGRAVRRHAARDEAWLRADAGLRLIARLPRPRPAAGGASVLRALLFGPSRALGGRAHRAPRAVAAGGPATPRGRSAAR